MKGAGILARVPMWLRLFLLSVVASTVYSLATPPWQAPDEPRHFEYVRLLYEKGRLVGWADADPELEREIVASMDRYDFWRLGVVSEGVFDPASTPERFGDIWAPGLTHELHQPPLAYMVYASVLPFTEGMDAAVQLRWMRWISVLLGALSVCMAYWTTREAFPEDSFLQVGVPAFIALLPMHAYLTGTVNNDHLAELIGCALVLLLVARIRRGFSAVSVLGAGALLVMGLLTKRTAAPLIPLGILAIVLGAWVRHGARRVWLTIATSFVVAVAAVTLVVFTWSHISEWLAGAAPAVLREIEKMAYVYVLYLFQPSAIHERSTRLRELLAPETLGYYWRYARMLFETFWARFGWLNVWLGKGWRLLLAIVTGGAAAGLARYMARPARGEASRERWQRACLVLFWAAVFFGFCLLGVQIFLQWDEVPRPTTQARFLFPEITPMAILFMLGVREWTASRHRRALLLGWVAWLVVLNIVCLMGYLVPYYHR